jgi:hypothetical protein
MVKMTEEVSPDDGLAIGICSSDPIPNFRFVEITPIMAGE